MPAGSLTPSWPSTVKSRGRTWRTSRFDGIVTARATSVARSMSSWVTSRWAPLTATVPRELRLSTWSPPTATNAASRRSPESRSACSIAWWIESTVWSMLLTRPFRRPDEGTVPLPMMSRAPSFVTSPDEHHDLAGAHVERDEDGFDLQMLPFPWAHDRPVRSWRPTAAPRLLSVMRDPCAGVDHPSAAVSVNVPHASGDGTSHTVCDRRFLRRQDRREALDLERDAARGLAGSACSARTARASACRGSTGCTRRPRRPGAAAPWRCCRRAPGRARGAGVIAARSTGFRRAARSRAARRGDGGRGRSGARPRGDRSRASS